MDLNGGTIDLLTINGVLPSFPDNDLRCIPNFSNTTLASFWIYQNNNPIGQIINNSNSNTYVPDLAYMTVTTSQLQSGSYQYNVLIQAIPYLNPNLACNTYYLETYYSPSFPATVPAITSSNNSFVYTQPQITAFGAKNLLLPTNNQSLNTFDVLTAVDTSTTYQAGNLPLLVSYFANNNSTTIFPLMFTVGNNGAWTEVANSPQFMPGATGLNQNSLVWSWLNGAAPANGTPLYFGFYEENVSSSSTLSIPQNNMTGSWVFSDTNLDPTGDLNYKGSFPVVAQTGAGDALISRNNNVDTHLGQVYIETAQTFPADDLPSFMTYYAANNNFLTPLLFSVDSPGNYTLQATGQSVQATSLSSLNTNQIVWNIWQNGQTGPLLGTTYALGFSDRQLLTQNGTMTQTPFAGTIPFDTSSSDFYYTVNLDTSTNLTPGQTYTTGNSPSYQLTSGRAYSVAFFSSTQSSVNQIAMTGNVSPSLANQTEVDFFVTESSQPNNGKLIYRATLASGGLVINADTGIFSAICPMPSKLPPGTIYLYGTINDGVDPPVSSGVSSPVVNGLSPAVTGSVLTANGTAVSGAIVSIGLFDGNIQKAGSPVLNIGPADGSYGRLYLDCTDTYNSVSIPSALEYYACNLNAFTPVMGTYNSSGQFQIAMVADTITPSNQGVNLNQINWITGSLVEGTTYNFGFAQFSLTGVTYATVSDSINTATGSGNWTISSPSSIWSLNPGSGPAMTGQPLSVSMTIITGANLVATGSAWTSGNGTYTWERPAGLAGQPYVVMASLQPPQGYFLVPNQQVLTTDWNGLPGSSANLNFSLNQQSSVNGQLNYVVSNLVTTLKSGAVAAKPLAHLRVFDDENHDGIFEPGETYVYSDNHGRYSICLAPGDHLLTVELATGYTPASGFQTATPVSIANELDVHYLPFQALVPEPSALPESQVLSPTKSVIYATPHQNTDLNGNPTGGYSIWLGRITGTASDQDGRENLQSVLVSVYDATARKFFYLADKALDLRPRWTTSTWVRSAKPLYMKANGTSHWDLQLPVMSLINGHRYTISSTAVDKQGHRQAAASTRTFTFESPYHRPSLVLKSPAGSVLPAGLVNLRAFIPRMFAGQRPPEGKMIFNIDGHVRSVNFYNTAALKIRLSPGRHTITVRLPGDRYYPTLTSNTIRLSVLPKGCSAGRKLS